MAEYTGILGEVVKEKREQFAARLNHWLDNDEEYQKRKGGKLLAQALGVHEMTLQSWKKARAFPHDEKIEALAKYFDVTVQEFLGTELAKYYKAK